MDKLEAKQILEHELSKYRTQSHEDLQRLLSEQDVFEVTGNIGTKYQIEIQAFWDDKVKGLLRVSGAIDDGGVSAYAPLCDDFIVSSQGEFIGDSAQEKSGGKVPRNYLTQCYGISRSKMKTIFLLLVGTLLGVVLCTVAIGSLHVGGTLEMLGAVLVEDQTVYAPGYSNDNFRRVRPNMSKAEVLELIGEPFAWNLNSPGEVIGYWSRACYEGNYRWRIIFFEGDRVKTVEVGYYWD